MSATALTSPGAGKILEVLCAVGDTVSAGQELVIVESMKVEIPVTASGAGRVTALHVVAGAQVREGDPLVTLG